MPAGDEDEVGTFMKLMKKWLKLSKIADRKIKTAPGLTPTSMGSSFVTKGKIKV